MYIPGSHLKKDTAFLAMPEGRRVGMPGHDKAREYLVRRMADIGLEPFRGSGYELSFEGTTQRALDAGQAFINIAGRIPGGNRNSSKPILIGAHYDSVIDAPCADDNATAVAVVLAVAEAVSRRPLDGDLVVVLFDSEEPPWFMGPDMGSNRFVDQYCVDQEFAGAFILDLIGHDVESGSLKASRWIPRIRNLLFVLGLESHPAMAAAVQGAATKGLTVFPTLNRYVTDMSDHHAFRVADIPFLFLTCAQGKYYHSPEDNMDWVNMRKVRKVFRYLLALVRSLDRCDCNGDEAGDTLAFEVAAIRKSLGWVLPIALKLLGIKKLESRQDMDLLAATLSGLLMGISLEPVEELEVED